MPAEIETRLEKRIRNFLWNDKTTVTINKETVYAPVELGGRNLLDLVARNEAITVTWLKSYLSFGDDRPLWAFVADEIMAKYGRGGDSAVHEAMRVNMYLQKWRVSRLEPIGPDLKRMINTADKYNVQMEALAVSREAQREASVWYHEKSRADNRLFNSGQAVPCLRVKHRVVTVGDAEILARKTGTARHTARRDCHCVSCNDMRNTVGCNAPHLCFKKARDMLDSLPQKWNPLRAQPEDYEEDDWQTNNTDAAANTEDGTVTFNTKITQQTLADTLRIFGEPGTYGARNPPDTKMEPEPDEEPNIVYTDGSSLENGSDNTRAGSGIYYGPNDARNMAIKIPKKLNPSNQVAEVLAVKETAEYAPLDIPL
ncbi:hypothetical protein B0H11DRAFT_1744415, partial [Mycena galericulata]